MNIVTKTDSNGRVISTQIVDANGRVVREQRANDPRQTNRGESITATPLPILPDPEPTEEELAAAAEEEGGGQEQANEVTQKIDYSAGDDARERQLRGETPDEVQEANAPTADEVRDRQLRRNTPDEVREREEHSQSAGGNISRLVGGAINRVMGGSDDIDGKRQGSWNPLSDDTRQSLENSNNPLARVELGRRALASGVLQGVENITDFGAAVVDMARGREVNDNDNFFQPTIVQERASSGAGRLASDITEFATTEAVLSILPGSSRVMRAARGAGGAGLRGAIASSAATGSITMFVSADQAEENMFDSLKGTPLESPVSRYLSSSNKVDEGFLQGQLRQTIADLPVGMLMDGGLELAGRALGKYITTPFMTYVGGLKAAKAVKGTPAEKDAMQAVIDATAKAQKEASEELTAAIQKDVSTSLKNADEVIGNRRFEVIEMTPEGELVQPSAGSPNQRGAGEVAPELNPRISEIKAELDSIDNDLLPENGLDDDVAGELRAEKEALEEELAGLESSVDVDVPAVSSTESPSQDALRQTEQPSQVPTPSETTQAPSRASQTPQRENPFTDIENEIVRLESQKDIIKRSGVTNEKIQEAVLDIDRKLFELEDTLDDVAQRNPGVARRTPDEVKLAVARTNYQRQVEVEASQPAVSKEFITANLDTEAAREAIKSVRSIDELLPSYQGRGSFLDLQASDKRTDRFLNTSKLGSSLDVRATAKMAMDLLPESLVKDSVSRPRILREAYNFIGQAVDMSPEELDGVFLVMAGSTKDVPKAALVARLMMKDLATNLRGSVDNATQMLASGVKDTDTSFLTVREGVMNNLARLQTYVASYKSLSKGSAQTLNYSAIDLSDANVEHLLAKAEYQESVKNADLEEGVSTYIDNLRNLFDSGPEGRKELNRTMNAMIGAPDTKTLIDVAKVTKFQALNNAFKTAGSFVAGLRLNGMLSGTRTHVNNIFSGATQTVLTPSAQILGSSLALPTRVLHGGKRAAELDIRNIKQSMAQLSATHQYFGDSMRLAAASFRIGKSIGDPGKAKVSDIPTGRVDFLNPDTGHWWVNAAIKGLGMPARFLTAGDELIKQVNYRAYVHGQAVVDGIDKGLKGKQLDDHVAFMLDAALGVNDKTGVKGLALDKTPKGRFLHDDASEYARYVTFQTQLSADNSRIRYSLKKVVDSIRKVPGGGAIANLYVPFVGTPLNIVAYTARFTPLGLISKQYQNDLAAGGIRQARAIGEMGTGLMALGYAYSLASSGRITGAPPAWTDKSDTQKFYSEGRQPYSIKIGGKWVSYQRVEPFGSLLGMVADAFQIAKETDAEGANKVANIAGAVALAFISTFKEKAFFEGFANMTETIEGLTSTEPGKVGRTFNRMLEQTVPTLIPYSSLLREFRQTFDPIRREVDGAMEAVRNTIPNLSKELPPKRYWWSGEVQTYNDSVFGNIFPSSEIEENETLSKMAELNLSFNPPSDRMGNLKLSSEQYSRYLELIGDHRIKGKSLLQAWEMVLDETLPLMPDDDIAYIKVNDEFARSSPAGLGIAKVTKKYRAAAREQLMAEYPELSRGIEEGQARRADLRSPVETLGSPIDNFLEEVKPEDDDDDDEPESTSSPSKPKAKNKPRERSAYEILQGL